MGNREGDGEKDAVRRDDVRRINRGSQVYMPESSGT